MDNHDYMKLEEEKVELESERDRYAKDWHKLSYRHGQLKAAHKALQEQTLIMMERHVSPPVAVVRQYDGTIIGENQYQKQKAFYKEMKQMNFWRRCCWAFKGEL